MWDWRRKVEGMGFNNLLVDSDSQRRMVVTQHRLGTQADSSERGRLHKHMKDPLITCVNLSIRRGEDSSFNQVVYPKKMPSQYWFVCLPVTLWMKIILDQYSI
jgi:hypothetical protein